MAGMRLRPDDDIRRIRKIWLGPTGFTLPVHATQVAWALFVAIFTGIMLVEWIGPMRVSTFPTWELAIAMVGATAVSGALDHDKPLAALPGVVVQHLRSPRRKSHATTYKPTLHVRVRNRETTR